MTTQSTIKEFAKRIHDWIQNERDFLIEWKTATQHRPVAELDSILERIEFNVMDAFYDYIYPEPCQECGRTGKDHDCECSHFDDEDSRTMDKYRVDSKVLDEYFETFDGFFNKNKG
jgi:hypothetical protein